MRKLAIYLLFFVFFVLVFAISASGDLGGEHYVDNESDDGFVYSNALNYPDAVSGGGGAIIDNLTTAQYITFGQQYWDANWFVYRTFIKFNTTMIPSNAIINYSYLSFYEVFDGSVNDFNMSVQNWTGDTPIGNEDFNLWDNVSYNEPWNSTDIDLFGMNRINLTNTSIINKSGFTKVCIRSHKDVEHFAPASNNSKPEYINFYSRDYWDTVSWMTPMLYVSYRVPKPEITGVSPVNWSTLSTVHPRVNDTNKNLSSLEVTLYTHYGALMNITIEENSSGSWLIINTSTNLDNGTYHFSNTSFVDEYRTTYYWRVNVTNSYGTTIKDYWFRTGSGPTPELTDNTNPSQGIETNTTFWFNLTYKISDADIPDNISVNISYGTWYDNSSLTYITGSNLTGANYSYNRTLPTTGTYNYVFFADSGNASNTTSGSVLVTTSSTFSLYFPLYVELGDYIMATGSIRNSTGEPLHNEWIYTQIRNATYINQLAGIGVQQRCMNGEYLFTITSTILTPGIYHISINFTDPELATNYSTNHTVYITYGGGPGHHVTPLYFTFYNNNTGVGLGYESFKVYVDNKLPLTSSDRIYGTEYYTYTGDTLYYRVDDYFDLQVYPNTGTYETVSITDVNQFEDVPIDWYSFGVKNMNSSVIKFTLQNSSRSYIQYLFPYEPFYWNVLEGNYNISKAYYYANNGTYYQTVNDTISITSDTFYWINGYNLDDIVIHIVATNSSITADLVTISLDINIVNSTVSNITTDIHISLTATESNLTNITNIIDSVVTFINSTVANFNSTIWTNLSYINATVIGSNLKIINMWTNCNDSFEDLQNRSTVVLSFYNTNVGLGMPDESFKVYINGSRYKETIYYVTNGSTIHLLVRDYYNLTMYEGNFTITSPYMFIDLGLTLHSYKFNNKNEEYYMISLLKAGASRWYERGVCPYETIEFMLPTGNYTLRIYNATYDEIYNSTLPPSHWVNCSMVYVIEGGNLSTVIAGQSTIIGALLELQVELGVATQPDIVNIVYNIPYIYSTYSSEGAIIGMVKICPAQVLMATTITTSYVNTSTTSIPLKPANTTANGTITIMNDRIFFEGPSTITWVNISYLNNSLIQNTSYIPSFFDPHGATVRINASGNMTIKRQTRFQQMTKFYWEKWTNTNYYKTTVTFENVLNVTLHEAYMYIEFANDTEPDYSTVKVKDVTNNVWLTGGENFDTTASAVQMAITSIDAGASRSIYVEYYGDTINIPSKDAIVTLTVFGEKRTHKDPFDVHAREKSYYYLCPQWLNNDTAYFKGPIEIAFAFDTSPYEIAVASIDVFDADVSRWLTSSEFVFTGHSIRILQDTVGNVPPNGARTFEIYYLYLSEEVEEDQTVSEEYVSWLIEPIFPEPLPIIGYFKGIHLALLILLSIAFGPMLAAYPDKYTMKKRRWILVLFLSIAILTIYGYLGAGGTF